MNNLIPAGLIAAMLILTPSASWSQESLGEFLVCGAGTNSDYVSGGADYVTKFKFRGLVMHEDPEHSLHSAVVTCHGERHTHPTEGNLMYSRSSCKIVDDDGHSFVFEDYPGAGNEALRRLVYALGKWEGLEGDVEMETIASSGPRSTGEYEICVRVTEKN